MRESVAAGTDMGIDAQLRDVVVANVRAALAEDVGSGDITALLIEPHRTARATIITREAGTFCGRPWAEETCRQVDAGIAIEWHVDDGDGIAPNQVLLELEGLARSLLTAERTILNFLQLLSGTATAARRFADAVADLPVKVLDTRKTLPGLRHAQKYAVRCGGCHNHRMGLYDAFLIKENHIAAAGSIGAAVAQAHRVAPGRPVEVEVEDLDELRNALVAKADIIMLDDFTMEQMRQGVAMSQGQAKLEASGGVNLARLRAIAETGVDFVSVGEITKKVTPLDLSMRFHD
jgi:nicotinate-nucleotide pyrophosphorylase (carboxylating)